MVGEDAAYLAAGDDLEHAGGRVDHDQHAARRRRQRGVQPLGERPGVALGGTDEDGELEAGDLLGRPDRLVEGDLLAVYLPGVLRGESVAPAGCPHRRPVVRRAWATAELEPSPAGRDADETESARDTGGASGTR